jgi:hypothetical protein
MKIYSAALILILLGFLIEPQAGTFYAIILTGGKSKEDAQRGVDHFNRLNYPFLQPVKGFPCVRASDGIKGLNPGFMISILGFCVGKAEAARFRELMNQDFQGVYVRKVEGDFKDKCPKIIPAEKPLAEVDVKTWPLKKGATGISWNAYYITEEGEGGCAPSTIHLRVEQNGITLAETIFSEECTPKSEEKDEETGEPLSWGGETKYSITPDTLGDLIFIDVASSETGDFDDVLGKKSLWGFLCGRLIEIPYGTSDYTTADGEDGIETAAKGALGWKHLVIFGTNSGREEFEQKLDWDEENCAFVEAGSQ